MEYGPHQVALVGPDRKTFGVLEWIGSAPEGVINWVWVDPAYRRQGWATKMLEFARSKVDYPITHSHNLSDEGREWSEAVGIKTAGPASGVIPDRVKDRRPVNTHAPKPVVIDQMAKRDIERLYPDEVPKVYAAIELLEQGKAPIEPKSRDELAGTFGIRIDRDCRLLVYPHIDGAWHVFYVGHHDYEEAERRMSAPRESSLQSGLFWRAHPRGRPLSIEDATSTQLNPPHERRRGYSCYREPWDLWVYMYVQRVMFAPQDREVVGFEGQRVGGGNDGEDLATPIRPVVRMSWGSFEHELLTTPFPPRPLKLVRAVLWGGLQPTWPSFAKAIRYQDDYHGDRVLERILDTWDS